MLNAPNRVAEKSLTTLRIFLAQRPVIAEDFRKRGMSLPE
jgi:hypothetical protein